MWAASPTDVWATGYGFVAHFDGFEWTPQTLTGIEFSREFRRVRGSGPNDVWIAGDEGKVLRYTGGAITVVRDFDGADERTIGDRASTLTDLIDVLPRASNDVWVLGHGYYGHAYAYHWTGSTWQSLQLPTDAWPGAVLERSGDLLITADGAVLQRDLP